MFLSKAMKVLFPRPLTLICIVYFYNLFATSAETLNSILENINCYNKPDDYLTYKADDKSKKSIFFVDLSCKGGLDSRQACAVEAASKANPGWRIFVLLAGPLKSDFRNGKTFTILSGMKNVILTRLNFKELLNATESKPQLPSRQPPDVVRNFFSSILPAVPLLILNKYGGVFLHLDMIVMKSFDTLPDNFFTITRESQTADYIMRLSKDGIGNSFAESALKELLSPHKDNAADPIYNMVVKTCNGTEGLAAFCRALNGGMMSDHLLCLSRVRAMVKSNPLLYSNLGSFDIGSSIDLLFSFYVVPDLVIAVCRAPVHLAKVRVRDSSLCECGIDEGKVYIIAREFFNPITYKERQLYYQDVHMEDWKSYTHHTWDHFKKNNEIKSGSFYARIANIYCPDVYHLYGDKFGA